MPSTKFYSSINPVIIFWLARELEKEIPGLDLYGSERRLLDFASKDLETWLNLKYKDANSNKKGRVLDIRDNQKEIKSFLKVWTKQWLEKWRERVTLCQKTPTFSPKQVKRKKRAKRILEHMEAGQELKKWVAQKLINKGEICMPKLIAENLIIEQIACRLKINKETASNIKTSMEPWNIFHDVLPQVNSLAKRKMPIIHMKLMVGS
jgi:hypothetical protein